MSPEGRGPRGGVQCLLGPVRADREDYSAFTKRTSLRHHDSFALGSFGRSCRPCFRRSVSIRLANGGGFGGWPPYMTPK
jgi:hypothetical protein